MAFGPRYIDSRGKGRVNAKCRKHYYLDESIHFKHAIHNQEGRLPTVDEWDAFASRVASHHGSDIKDVYVGIGIAKTMKTAYCPNSSRFTGD